MVFGLTLENLSLHFVPLYWFILFGKRLSTTLLRHLIRKYPDSPSTRYRIRCRFFFSTLESGLKKISGFAAEFAGCVWTEAVSGKKKLRIQKYPGGQGLKLLFEGKRRRSVPAESNPTIPLRLVSDMASSSHVHVSVMVMIIFFGRKILDNFSSNAKVALVDASFMVNTLVNN